MSGPEKEQWKKAIRKEFDNMQKYGVFKIVPKSGLKQKVTFLDSKWVMKKKSNGTLRARLTARGFKQIDGEHYDSDDVSSPTIKHYVGTSHVCTNGDYVAKGNSD